MPVVAQKPVRLVGCQGTAQLITAITAMRQISEYQDADNYLVVYDLMTSVEQLPLFFDYIKKMAFADLSWVKCIHLSPDKITAARRDLDILYSELSIRHADEIYLARSWQAGNDLLMRAFQSARKVCYGDSIGVYFPPTYFGDKQSTYTRIKQLVKNMISREESIRFDLGCFLLQLGDAPPMPTVKLDMQALKNTFGRLQSVFNVPWFDAALREASGKLCFLMTSNFAESGRMTREAEVRAYSDYLSTLDLGPEATVFIKPHPRDTPDKIVTLQKYLSTTFKKVVALVTPDISFVPFELIYKHVVDAGMTAPQTVTFSTACLPLPVLFGAQPQLGFGDHIVRQYFSPEFIESRIQHERDLRRLMANLLKT